MTFDRCLMGRTHFGEMAMGGVAFYWRREAGKLETGKRTKNERQKNERHPNMYLDHLHVEVDTYNT
jgi:hypothetical protein